MREPTAMSASAPGAAQASAAHTQRALLAWVRAAKGAIQWHLEAGEEALEVPAGFQPPPLGQIPPRSGAPATSQIQGSAPQEAARSHAGSQGMGTSPQGMGPGSQGMGTSPQGPHAGPQGMDAGPQGMGAGPQGMGAGSQGMGAGPQGPHAGPHSLPAPSTGAPPAMPSLDPAARRGQPPPQVIQGSHTGPQGSHTGPQAQPADAAPPRLDAAAHQGRAQLPPGSLSADEQAALALHRLERAARVSQHPEGRPCCALCQNEEHELVFGVGAPDARLMFVAAQPELAEQQLGLPFVGEPGVLLARMIRAIHLSRRSVYLTHLFKCASLQVYAPEVLEASRRLFDQQLAIVRPQVIVALGDQAAQMLCNSSATLTMLRGQWAQYTAMDGAQSYAVLPTFHPRALIEASPDPRMRAQVWDDLKKVARRLNSAAPGRGAAL